jgi:chorismate mutase
MTEDLETLRRAIDSADEELLAALENRMTTSREIGAYKRAHNILPLDKNRWQELLDARVKDAGKRGLSPEFVKKLYTLIHKESVAEQERV